MAAISLKEALLSMRTGKPFDIEIGLKDGRRAEYIGARVSSVKDAATLSAGDGEKRETQTKNPWHNVNATMNIILANRDIITIYPIAIELYNGKMLIP